MTTKPTYSHHHPVGNKIQRFKSIYSTMYRHQSYKTTEQCEKTNQNIFWWVHVWRPSLRPYGRYHKGHQKMFGSTVWKYLESWILTTEPTLYEYQHSCYTTNIVPTLAYWLKNQLRTNITGLALEPAYSHHHQSGYRINSVSMSAYWPQNQHSHSDYRYTQHTHNGKWTSTEPTLAQWLQN